MIIIAHRGNLNGSIPQRENAPDYIEEAISKGFYAEVDVWLIDGKWWLGHDKPQYEITIDFFDLFGDHLFIHTKNIEALYALSKIDLAVRYGHRFNSSFIHYFFHDKDQCVLTSNGYIWSYPDTSVLLTDRSIACMPERVRDWDGLRNCCGICTDYAVDYKKRFLP